MIGLLGFGIKQGAAKSVGLEQDIGVGEQQPVTGSLLRGAPHGVGFAQPAGGQAR